jgi:hypothetical protein
MTQADGTNDGTNNGTNDGTNIEQARFSNLWYVVAEADGYCRVMTAQQLASHGDSGDEQEEEMPTLECWGPFSSETEAIAKRANLIQSGTCKIERGG